MKKTNTFKITIMSIAVVINIVGAFIATALKLPIFIDTIGTFLSAFLFGPVGGMLTGVVTSLINGLTFDPYSYDKKAYSDLTTNAKKMVDDYLETCKEIGKEPQKTYSGTFNIRTTPEIHQTLVEIAKMENVSLNK